MARKSFTEHPEFMNAGRMANAALETAAARMGCLPGDLNSFDLHANRVVDDMTRLLLRAYDARQLKSKAA